MKILHLILVTLTLIACSSSKTGEEKLQLDIEVSELHSWLNLMPGSPDKFHLLGELKITNLSSEVIEELKLDKIIIYSNKDVVYSFFPFLNLKDLSEVNSIESGGNKEFTFGVESGLKVDKRLMENNLIDIKMKFISGSEYYQLNLNDIIVEQAF
ncbi:MAG: hypothetical protein DRQ01_06505 [Ignavibacteriae bacterium]|nr:MAG: hypothetical protein DRQ01_06505 [Ignavibacteriota bacterium]